MGMTDRHQVEIVSMDMRKSYRRAVQAVPPPARIVVDKFHVVRMANEALENIRKGLRKGLTINQRRPSGRPEDTSEAGSRRLRPRTAHHGDLDKGFPPALGSLRAQGTVLPHLGLH